MTQIGSAHEIAATHFAGVPSNQIAMVLDFLSENKQFVAALHNKKGKGNVQERLMPVTRVVAEVLSVDAIAILAERINSYRKSIEFMVNNATQSDPNLPDGFRRVISRIEGPRSILRDPFLLAVEYLAHCQMIILDQAIQAKDTNDEPTRRAQELEDWVQARLEESGIWENYRGIRMVAPAREIIFPKISRI